MNETLSKRTSARLKSPTALLLLGFSILYFADVCLRASEKYFWFDEIATVFQARLSLPRLWEALHAGFDFNPPLVYLLTKAANALFGEGLIVTRLPEIIGFWIFCVCLFFFVKRRAGAVAGFSAMVLPVFTGAFFYAFEARPYGVVLGCCGLALVAWQRSLERRREGVWLMVFAMALFGACVAHCYAIAMAVPFWLAELLQAVRSRRIEYRRWIALLAPLLAAGITYVPLLSAFRSTTGGTIFRDLSPARPVQIANFYEFLLTPCFVLVMLILIVLAVKGMSKEEPEARASFPVEVSLALFFLFVPAFGLLLALKMHSAFYSRYFLSGVAGFCILAVWGVSLGKSFPWAPRLLAGILGLWLFWDVSSILGHRARGWPERLVEPSSGFSSNSSLAGPLANYQMLVTAAKRGERIVILWPIDFLYLVNYAPEIRSQLYFVSWVDEDPFYPILDRTRDYAPFSFHVEKWERFHQTSGDFMLFGLASDEGQLHMMAGDKAIKSLQFSEGRFLADVSVAAK